MLVHPAEAVEAPDKMITFDFDKKSRTPLEQLQSYAKASGFYDENVLSTVTTNEQKISYLQMLSAANTLALKERLGEDYNNISDPMTKFWHLENEYRIAVLESAKADAEYQKQLDSSYKQSINEKFSQDERIASNAAISGIVNTKYGGDYSKFMSEYTSADDFFSDEYLAYAGEYDEDETRDILDYMRTNADDISANPELSKLYERRDALNQAIAADKLYRIKQKAYEDASWVEKFASSLVQMTAAPVTELGNVVEGVLDASALLATQFVDYKTAQELENFIAKDTIALDTLLAESLPNSYITSPYAPENPLRWLYNIETSLIDMAPLALNTVVPGLGSFLYYYSSAGRTAEGYILENPEVSLENVVAYTATVTTIECLTEKLNADAVFTKGFFGKYTRSANISAKSILAQGLGESVEEIASEIGSQLVGSAMTGENKFDGKQILLAGAYGAATGMIIQTGSVINMRRSLFGISTRITNASGDSVVLNLKDSTILREFMSGAKAKLDDGKTLSKRDQELYDKFSGLNFSDEIVGDTITNIKMRRGRVVDYDIEYTSKWHVGQSTFYEDFETAEDFMNYAQDKLNRGEILSDDEQVVYNEEIAKREALKVYNEEIAKREALDELELDNAELFEDIEQLQNAVKLGEDYSEIAEKIIPENDLSRMQSEMSSMSKIWANNLLAAADENAQSVVAAVNEYYQGTLERIAETLEYKYNPHPSSAAHESKLRDTLNITARLTLPKDEVAERFLRTVQSVYPEFKNKIRTYTTDSTTSPIVTIIDGTLYVNHRFIKAMSLPSLTRAIETQYLTDKLYKLLDEKTKDYLGDLSFKLFGFQWQPARAEHLRKQIMYSALFVPGNDVSIQLSELDHKTYESFKSTLAERAKSNNIAVRNTAYRGMFVYDTTLLKRLSAEEATEKNLLSGNYSIQDLITASGGPDAERQTFKYGIDASTAGVRVLSAIRHLTDNFGLETDVSNIYRALRDMLNPDKYKNFKYFETVLKRYDLPASAAINHYLGDQFDFEIDAYGTILATADVSKMVDINKINAALANEKYIPLRAVLTDFGKLAISDTDCLIAFINADSWQYGEKTEGRTTRSAKGISLIEVRSDQTYRTVVHEIQHYLTGVSHLPTGIHAVLDESTIAGIADALPESERLAFADAARTFVFNNADEKNLSNIPEDAPAELLYHLIPDILYFKFDVDEDYSNFKINRRLIHSIDSTIIGESLMRTVSTIEIPNDHRLSEIDYNFLKYFDGKTFNFKPADDTINELIGRIIGKTATLDDIMAASFDLSPVVEQKPSEAKTAFDILSKIKEFAFGEDKPTDKDLCSPEYLASKIVDDNLRARILRLTPEQCKLQLSRITNLVFDEYAGKFVEPGKSARLNDYIKYRSNDSIIITKSGSTLVQLPRDYSPKGYPELTTALNAIPAADRANARYFVDDRIFANMREVLAYTNSDYINAAQQLGKPNNKILAEFDKLIDHMPANGFRHENDFAFVTNDGKTFSFKTKGKPGELLKLICNKLNVNFNLINSGMTINQSTGEYAGILENGIIAKLFDAKKIVRAYYIDGEWQAYGKPNRLQDVLLRQMNTTSDRHSYILPEDDLYTEYVPGTTKLVVNAKGNVVIDRSGQSDNREVSWKTNAWYKSICQIIEKYDIHKISEFKDLGFSEDFIDSMTKNLGRAVQSKTAGKLGLSEQVIDTNRRYSGLEQDSVTRFINDSSASVFARNILIQNAPERASTDNLNWQLSPHIRSVEDADKYLKAILAYSGTMRRTNNTKKYSSLEELIYDCKKSYIAGDEEKSLLVNELGFAKTSDNVFFTNIVSEFLNLDCRKAAKFGDIFAYEGLDYSLEGFGAAAGIIRRGFTKSSNSAESKSGQTISIETTVQGRHADENSELSIVDTDMSQLDKATQLNPENITISEDDQARADWFKRQINKAKQAAKTEAQYKVFLNKIRRSLEAENQKSIDTIDEPDRFILSLIQRLDNLINQSSESEQTGLDKYIESAKKRIESSNDKRSAQATEYQLLTSKAVTMRAQYGEKGYQKALAELGSEAILGETTGLSNINSNISKRLASTGSASIDARIDKLIGDPQLNAKLKHLTDVLRNFKEYFSGISVTASGYTNMRFKYSNLLTDYYNFIQSLASSGKTDGFASIKAQQKEIADYLDSFVLTGDFNFNKVYPEYGAWTEYAENLIAGNFTDPNFIVYNDLSLDDRIKTLQSWISAAISDKYPIPVIDRMQQILEDAVPEQIPSQAKKTKPAINLNILAKARNDAGLSADITAALDKTIEAVNAQAKLAKEDKHKLAEANAAVKSASTAAFNAKYVISSYDRLSREYRSYLNSPEITQDQAEALVKHAADMIRNFDFQTKTDLFRKEAKQAWKDDERPHIMGAKALLYRGAKGEWPKKYSAKFLNMSEDDIKFETAQAAETQKRYIQEFIDNKIAQAPAMRRIQNAWNKDTSEVVRAARKLMKYLPAEVPELTSDIALAEQIFELYVERSTLGDSVSATKNSLRRVESDLTSIQSSDDRKPLYAAQQRLGKQLNELTTKLTNINEKFDGYTSKYTSQLIDAASKLPSKITEAVTRETPTYSGAQSVDDLLNMYTEVYTPSRSDEPKLGDQFTIIHRTFDDIIDQADKLLTRGITENSTLNNIINGVSLAMTEFQYRPMTLASAIKFILDIRTVLADRTINRTLFSWKNNIPTEKLARRYFVNDNEASSVESINKLLKRLDSGVFTSKSDEIEVELKQSATEVQGVINSYIDELKEITVTEADTDLNSDLSQAMRYEFDEITDDMFEDEDSINDMFDDSEQTPNAKLSDLEFDFEWYDSSNDTKESEVDIPKATKKHGDQRSLEEQFPGFDEDAARSSYKTVKSDLLTRNGVNLETALNYEFRKTQTVDVMGVSVDRTVVNTEEFVNNPVIAKIMGELKASEPAMKDFITWLKEAKSIDSEVQLKALIILNKIVATPGVSFDILRDAKVLQKQSKSVAAAILALGTRHGLTPVEELNSLAMSMFELSEDDIKTMKTIAKRQDDAIEAGDYSAADKAMQEALTIFEKYKDKLDTSINPFTAQSTEERAIRWKNLSDKITSWRYFAMLSAPSTFWAKNYVGNYVAKGFNDVSSILASKIQQYIDKTHSGKYTRTNKVISDDARQAVATNLIDNGLVDSIVSNTVAKYDTGYTYRPSDIRNLTKGLKDGEELSPEQIAKLNQLVSAKSPFGDNNNAVSKVLNKYYAVIFNTMNDADRKFVRSDIIRLTERLVSDNLSRAEITALRNKNISDDLRAKFEDIVEYSRQQALKTYFRSTPKIYNTLMSLFKDHPVARTVFSVICPFPRMVLNTTMTALAYSPVGFIQAAMTLKNAQSMFANITASQQFAKATTGTVAMLIGGILAALGAIEIDDEDPYAGPQLMIFEKLRISLEGLEPSATPFIVGSMFVLGPKSNSELNAFASAAQTLLDTTILGELMSQFGQGKTSTEWVGDTFSSYVTQFIPTVLKRATQVVDPAKKDYSGGFETVKRIAATVPGLSFLVPNKIDPYTGEDLVQYTDNNNAFVSRLLVTFNTLSPTKVSLATDSLVERESKTVDAATTGPSRTITVNGESRKLSKKQYNDYKILRAKLYSKYANELINTEAYKKLSIEKKRAKLKKLQTKATEDARKQLNLS